MQTIKINNNGQIVLCAMREGWAEYFGNVVRGEINSDLGITEGFLEVVVFELGPEVGTSLGRY